MRCSGYGNCDSLNTLCECRPCTRCAHARRARAHGGLLADGTSEGTRGCRSYGDGWTQGSVESGMAVDMWESRFRQELWKVDRFAPDGTRDLRVWPAPDSEEGVFPAWRALFTSGLLQWHSAGYQLFSYEQFFNFVRHTLTRYHKEPERFARYFEDPLLSGMRHRVAVWYESGMAETYLYSCLVEAIEDRAKIGVVSYDARVDWKLKADALVHVAGKTLCISAFAGRSAQRPGIESRRAVIERERKTNTSESAHWGNLGLRGMKHLSISVTETESQLVNGCRLFSKRAVNGLLHEIYEHAEVPGDDRWIFRIED